METFFVIVKAAYEKQLVIYVTVIVMFCLYFSIDIFLALTRRDYGNANIYVIHFIRNEGGKKDAMVMREIRSRIPLRKLYRNRFFFWGILWFSLHTTIMSPVLKFGRLTPNFLKPIRGIINSVTANNTFKRAAGFKYEERQYMMAIVRSRSEDRQRSKILRILLILKSDLDHFAEYLEKPPAAESNFDLVQRTREDHVRRPQDFLKVSVVVA